jgi:hypothetical protein
VEEAALLVDLYAADRKFSEYYNVLNPFFASHVCVLAQVSTYSSSLSEVLQELFTRALALKKKFPCLPCPFSPCSVELISEWAWFVCQKVLEQILGILLRLIKEFKLQHQHEYVGVLSKFSLCISMWVLVDTC